MTRLPAPPEPAMTDSPSPITKCKTCNGTGVVDDGEITHSGGVEFSNGPIKCVKDCPACGGRTAPLCDERSSEGSARPVLTLERAVSLLRQWTALDAGSWHADRHARDKTDLIAATNAAIEAASPSPQLSSLSGWVSVKDRLPKPWAEVLLALSNGQVTTGEFCGPELGAFNWHETDEDTPETCVTHWMPLPPPPQS